MAPANDPSFDRSETDALKSRLREYLSRKGRLPDSSGKYQCIRPQNHSNGDTHFSCTIYDEERLFCPICNTTDDVYEIAGELEHLRTFPDKKREVRQTLGILDNAARQAAQTRPATGEQTNNRPSAFIPLALERAREVYAAPKLLDMARNSKFIQQELGTDAVKIHIADAFGHPAVWPYKNGKGEVEIVSIRFENGVPGKKAFMSFWYDGKYIRAKKCPTRLLGIPELLERPDAPVLIVEGEKCWEKAKEIPGFTPVTWNGGAKRAKYADWSPIDGRDVFIFPDDDKPGSDSARLLKDILGTRAKSVRIAAPLEAARKIKAKGADIVEALEVLSAEELARYIREGPELTIEPDPVLSEKTSNEKPTTTDPPMATGTDSIPAISEKAIEAAQKALPFRIVGIEGGETLIARSMRSGSMVHLPVKAITKSGLLLLAPLSWWEQSFPAKSDFNVTAAIDFLLEVASKHGAFDPEKVRGRGAWKETEGRYVFNTGLELIEVPSGRRVLIDQFESRYCYETGPEIEIAERPATAEEGQRVFDLLTGISWESESERELFGGVVFDSIIPGALPWRPHGMIRGQKGTGKSGANDCFAKPIVGDAGAFLLGDSSPAGIRQLAGADSRSIYIDEAESDDEKQAALRQAVMRLARASSSGGEIAKGTRGGDPDLQTLRGMFVFFATTSRHDHDADSSRWTILKVKKEPNRAASFVAWKEKCARVLTPELCARIRARAVSRIPQIVEAAAVFACAAAAPEALNDGRAADQLGAILAGAHVLQHDERPSDTDAKKHVAEILGTYSVSDEPEMSDGMRCLFGILEHTVRIGHSDKSILELINDCRFPDPSKSWEEQPPDVLRRHGIIVDRVQGGDLIHLAYSHEKLAELAGSWRYVYGQKLQELTGDRTGKGRRFDGIVRRTVTIPAKILDEFGKNLEKPDKPDDGIPI